MSYLLDTNVISEFSKSSPHPNVVEWVQTHQEDFLCLSVVSIGEFQQGIARLPVSKKRQRLTEWFHDILEAYTGQILPIDTGVMLQWGTLSANLIQQGRKMPVMDAMIAATCLHYDLMLVTRNVSDFAQTNIQLINPWG